MELGTVRKNRIVMAPRRVLLPTVATAPYVLPPALRATRSPVGLQLPVPRIGPTLAAATAPPPVGLPAADPAWADEWFRHATLYQVRVGSFCDSAGLGHGDLRGITQNLDHIQKLGNTLWLSPFCRSPMRDGGYDVADYTRVDPSFGSDADLDALIDACHARGMRVIVELVGNHSSIEHPWFLQESLYRSTYAALRALHLAPDRGRALLAGAAPQNSAEQQARALLATLQNSPHQTEAETAGYYPLPAQQARLAELLYGNADAQTRSTQGDFYLWTEAPEQHFREAFLAFPDVYKSAWAQDAASGQYYYHTFFDHQADLNYASPRMCQAMEDVIRHWVKRGADGLRIDAAPFFWKEEGTSCMNLPGMHTLFQGWRALLAKEAPNVVLLAEAVQPAEQLRAYYGNNDECHMMFNAPLAEGLLHALAVQTVAPLQQAIAGLAKIPPRAQLVTFLRNHDEFYTAWMSPEDEQRVLDLYAPDPAQRVHHGLCRRLASMVNNPDAVRLVAGLLYMLPGSPTVYYGDEIGMGDRFTEIQPGPIHDRDAVRTPMQWTPEHNAGFSAADTDNPPIATGPYAYKQVNVQSQDRDPQSLLNWHRRLVAMRAEWPLLASGDLQWVNTGNPHVVAFTRSYNGKQLLVLANLHHEPATMPMAPRTGNMRLWLNSNDAPVAGNTLAPLTLQVFAL